MTTSMMKPIDYLFRWPSVVALLGGILAAMVMLLVAASGQSGAQTTEVTGHVIAAGHDHSLAIVSDGAGDGVQNDGTVWAWGDNYRGKLGVNSNNDHAYPVQVHGVDNVGYLSDVVDVAAGTNHSLAVTKDGHVYAWGGNDYGQLGVNSDNPHFTPVQVHGPDNKGYLSDVVAVAAGEHHSLAIVSDGAGDGVQNDGTVWAWGRNNHGQLGVNSDNPWKYPVQVHGLNNVEHLSDVKAVAAGWYHSLALKNDGTVWAWGKNRSGQLGDTTTTERHFPVQVRGLNGVGSLRNVTDVDAGDEHSLAIDKIAGTVYAWGDNFYGQLGVGDTTNRDAPVQVDVPVLTDVAGGVFLSLALKSDSTVWAWGANGAGKLGTGSDSDPLTTPEQVGPTGYPGATEFRDAVDVDAGAFHTLALKSDGTVWAWGFNPDGQLGDGTTTDRTVPVQVHGPNNVGYLIVSPPTSSPPGGENPPDEHPPDVAICHKAETPQAKTFYVPSSKAERLLNKKGYMEGACEE